MTTALTPHQILADIAALDRLEHDWLQQGRLDAITEADLKAKRAELMDDLRERFSTQHNEAPFADWYAWEGDMDEGIPVAYGKTEIEAIETLLEMIGEDVA